MPVLERGCCCCSLEACVRTQGCCMLVISFILVGGSIFGITLVHKRIGDPKPEHQDSLDFLRGFEKVLVAVVVLSVASVVLALLLLRGVDTRNKDLLVPYMVLSVVCSVANLCIMFFMLSGPPSGTGGLNTAIQVIVLALQVYFLLHVYSLYRRLKSEESASRSVSYRL